MHADLAERRRIDFEQHRNDHHPDKRRDRQIDLGHGGGPDRVEERRRQMPEDDAGYNAEADPKRKIALEEA